MLIVLHFMIEPDMEGSIDKYLHSYFNGFEILENLEIEFRLNSITVWNIFEIGNEGMFLNEFVGRMSFVQKWIWIFR